MNEKHRDTIYARPRNVVGGFEFDESVAAVFPNMILRSVPGYASIVSNVGVIAGYYALPDSNCYDLGCSLGAATLSMRHQIVVPNCRIVAVDNAEAMVNRCRANIEDDESTVPVDVHCADLRPGEPTCVTIERASFVVLNFTLQFIPVEQREQLLKTIFDGMLPGSALVVSEKIAFADANEQQLQTDLHLAFKRANGYSDLEISQKRAALENVLVPETIETHAARFKAVGFASSHVWFQALNFVSMLAVK
ncbi:MAG: tRNA (cmo5U34)-methyltransferase [Pirellulaceae bacterium]|jgi:tRNA (cmo5U34)-methyltransferase